MNVRTELKRALTKVLKVKGHEDLNTAANREVGIAAQALGRALEELPEKEK